MASLSRRHEGVKDAYGDYRPVGLGLSPRGIGIDVARLLVDATYFATQNFLAAEGVMEMRLFRGMGWVASGDVPPAFLRALSLPMPGFGCLVEADAVVLGDTEDCAFFAVDATAPDCSTAWLQEADGDCIPERWRWTRASP